MIINARLERRLSIAATALLTAAVFVMPAKTRVYTSVPQVNAFSVADASPVARLYPNQGPAKPR